MRLALLLCIAAPAFAAQNETGAYTRYELLAPGSASFRILYEITATTPGATAYFNPIRKGSIATDERVTDRATGKPLAFDVVGMDVAGKAGESGDADQKFIRVKLSRPVPANGGQARLLIDKTYQDSKSYYSEGPVLVFQRGLGIKRNAVVLPKGYELIACNYPSQVLQEADGRIAISFWNTSPAEAPLLLKARPVSARQSSVRLEERAHQDREIVYLLQQPDTHAFDLFHDYTESRPGSSTYVNVVRPGSSASKPSARNLDTGEELKWELVKGQAIKKAGLDVKEIKPDTEVVLFHFAPIAPGTSMRLRVSETYTDPARYRLQDGELTWDRGFGRPANAVVLPAGWMLTNSSVPATVSEQDGRVRLDFINPRNDELAVLVTARRR